MSSCRKYRYVLERSWAPELPTVMFIGLNPSTADGREDDPTVRRCIGFAMRWGFGALVLTNLFGYRTTDPRKLTLVGDPVGPRNDRCIDEAVQRSDLLVAAWGTRGGYQDRDRSVSARIENLKCLGTTKSGHPRHPLYLRHDATLRPFEACLARVDTSPS
jgi:hypothetical protein